MNRHGISHALRALFGAFLIMAMLAPAALAAAGGGSSGFSGGGGGSSGGGSSGFGGGSGGGSGGGDGSPLLTGIIIFLVFGFFVVSWIYRQALKAFYNQRVRGRHKRVVTASAEAAQDDAAFAADVVMQGADQLFRRIQAAWSQNDIATLEQLVSSELMIEWRRRLEDFESKGWHNQVDVVGDVKVEYVALVNREADVHDRAVVRICANLRDRVITKAGRTINRTGESSEFTKLREYWTLGKREDDSWWLLSIEQDAEGAHHIESEIVASPWDDSRIRDEALVEGAVADKVVDGFKISEVADLDFDGDAHAAALDLSLADARFAPDILETAARRAVGGWAEAVDGDDDELAAVASAEALRELLYPQGHDKRRLVVRGPRIERVRIATLDAAAEPPTMIVEVHVRGRRYVQDRDTAAIVSGSDRTETEFTERWLMSLSGDDRNPWRIVDASALQTQP